MIRKQKGFVHFFLLLIFALVMFVGIGYYAYKNGQTKLNSTNTAPTFPNPNVPDVDVVNWKTYNSNYGWVIDYPANWYVYDKGYRFKHQDGKIEWFNYRKEVLFSPVKFPEYLNEGTEHIVEGFRVFFSKSEDFMDKSTDFNSLYNKGSENLIKTQVDGKRAVKFVNDSRNEDDSIPPAYKGLNITYYIDYGLEDQKMLQLSAVNIEKSNVVTESLIDQAISTIKFIDNNTWKEYRNNNLGFSLSHPVHFQVESENNTNDNRNVFLKSKDSTIEVLLKYDSKMDGGAWSLEEWSFLDNAITGSTQLGGYKANIYISKSGYGDGPNTTSPFVAIVTKKGHKFYHLVFYNDSILSDEEKKVISSFKFIE